MVRSDRETHPLENRHTQAKVCKTRVTARKEEKKKRKPLTLEKGNSEERGEEEKKRKEKLE